MKTNLSEIKWMKNAPTIQNLKIKKYEQLYISKVWL